MYSGLLNPHFSATTATGNPVCRIISAARSTRTRRISSAGVRFNCS